MASLNKVMLIGNLTRDPDMRYTPKGSAVADIAIAVNRMYSAENGDKREEVTYVDVVLWARLAELANQYLKKGRPIFVEGRLQMDSWEDKATGQKRSRLRVVGENIQFLGAGREGGPMGMGGEEGYSNGPGPSGPPPQSSQRPQQGGGRPGGGYQQRPSSGPPRGGQSHSDDFGEGPITDDLDDDEIPF